MIKYFCTLLGVFVILFQNGIAFSSDNNESGLLGSVNFGEIREVKEVQSSNNQTRITTLISSSLVELLDFSLDEALFNNSNFGIFSLDSLDYSSNERYEISSAKDGEVVLKSKISKGDTSSSLLNEWVSMTEIFELEKRSKSVYSMTSLRLGQPFYITVDAKTKSINRFEYEIDSSSMLIVDFTEEESKISILDIPYEIELAYVEGKIDSSFYEAVLDAGENANFVFKLAQVFVYDIDFFREIRRGDSFTALVEKRYREGKLIGYGRILGATFSNGKNDYEAFLFFNTDDSSSTSYFRANGNAVQKLFLRTPVKFTRVSSGYTMRRKHPILGITRPHQGIDYAAPTGTPVVAVADGTVTRASYTGGYGHLVKISHAGKLVSQYAHLSKYGRGVKSGTKVKQGQIIGYVGSTGLSTGPHLDFRIQQNGKFVNPDSLISVNHKPVKTENMDEFNGVVDEIKALMAEQSKRKNYNASVWLNGIK